MIIKLSPQINPTLYRQTFHQLQPFSFHYLSSFDTHNCVFFILYLQVTECVAEERQCFAVATNVTLAALTTVAMLPESTDGEDCVPTVSRKRTCTRIPMSAVYGTVGLVSLVVCERAMSVDNRT